MALAATGKVRRQMPDAISPERTTAREALLDLDPDLTEGLSDELAAQARDRFRVMTVQLSAGAWRPADVAGGGTRPFALLVCQGVVVRELDLADTITADLLGPGDLVSLAASREPLLVIDERWHAGADAKVAILDERVVAGVHAYPALTSTLLGRSARQAARAAEQRAISQLPRVDLRIRALLWHLAERWGRVGPAGVVLPLELTHGALGALVGARRPTVTLALNDLAREGLLMRRDDGAWLLRADSRPTGSARAVSGESMAISTLENAPERPPPPPAFDANDLALLKLRVARVRDVSLAQRRRSLELIARTQANRDRLATARAGRSRGSLAEILHEEHGAGDVGAVEAERHRDDAAGDRPPAAVDRVEHDLDA
jgi:CRP/FNR family transcriptional regulator, cyclic AMP receptor protein